MENKRILEEWSTIELIEFLNSYRKASFQDYNKYSDLYNTAVKELGIRNKLLAMLYY